MQNNTPDNQHINIIVNAECRAYLIYLYVCHVLITKTNQAMTTTTQIATTKLRNGVTVLAKVDKFGVNPVGYTNLKQAGDRQSKLSIQGIDCSIYRTPTNASVTYIKIN